VTSYSACVDKFITMPGFTSFSQFVSRSFPTGVPPAHGEEIDILVDMDTFKRPALEELTSVPLKPHAFRRWVSHTWALTVGRSSSCVTSC
jgi:hypothetical protein